MNQITECTYCDGNATIVKNPKTITYRKEPYKVIEHFYKCLKCKREFTTTEIDELTMVQVHNQYREKYNIPFIDEISVIRGKYELSAAKMSEVLGLGINGYSNFERGEVPGPALGNLISTAANPKVFLSFVEKGRSLFTEKGFEKLKQRIGNIVQESKNTNIPVINWFIEPNNYTGYRKPDLGKIIDLLSILISNCNPDFNDKLKLNKLLFYADFYNYSQVGQSITGLTYRAIPYGPAPTYYDNIFSYLSYDNIIVSKWTKDENGAGHECFEVQENEEHHGLSQKEMNSIEMIISKFQDTPSWELVELSHKERSWKELKEDHELISYQEYAFDLFGIIN